MDPLFGLPAHPLPVHIPVVLIPTALMAAVLALWPRVRYAAAVTAAAFALAGAVGAYLAIEAGEKLQEEVRETELVEEHAEQGDTVELPAIAFALLALADAAAAETTRRRALRSAGRPPAAESTVPPASEPASPTVATDGRVALRGSGAASWLPAIVLCASVLAGAVATYTLVEVGHSGAKATWSDLDSARSGSGGDGSEGQGDDDDD